MKVLQCPIVALYQPWLYAKGLREMGIDSQYMLHEVREKDLFFARGFDYNIGPFDPCLSGGWRARASRDLDFMDYAVKNYDVFHFHSGFGLSAAYLWGARPLASDLAYLKGLGKKIVMSWWGCDIRTERVDGMNEWSACKVCALENRKFCARPEKLKLLELVDKYADVQLSGGDICASYPYVRWINNAIDVDEFRPLSRDEIPENYRLPLTDKIRIYHSFGNASVRGDVKGSTFIKAAVERLRNEGYGIEFIYVDNVPNRDVKYLQAQADIVVDQLRCGWHGSAGVECLAMGKPVITYIRPTVERIVPQEHPLINANPDTVYQVLKALLDNRDSLVEIGRRSREYAVRFHDYRVIASRLKELYERM